jgi:protein kinase A
MSRVAPESTVADSEDQIMSSEIESSGAIEGVTNFAVETFHTHTNFAVKMYGKYKLVKALHEEHAYNEIKIMASLSHPMILKMYGVAQDPQMLYLFLEYMKHGDLTHILQRFMRLDLPLATFYAAQIVLVFEYLHDKNIIYRDLKPENILVSETGYIKLADFGFVKRLYKWERTQTFCGTPEYMAPEIVGQKAYGHSADWYALGIMLYELMVGHTPFVAPSPDETFRMIMN